VGNGRQAAVVQRAASVRSQTYQALRRAIVQCRIKPHQPLSEKEIADALEVSRTPVREALLQLADEGLVLIVPQQGTITTPISISQVREAQLIREMLERAALAAAAQLAPREAFARLQAYIEEQKRQAASDDVEAFLRSDQQFHADLAGLSTYANLGRIANSARAHLDRVRSLSLPEETLMDDLIQQHEDVIRAMGAGDLAAADRTLTAHLRNVLEILPRMRARYPDFFTDELYPEAPPPRIAVGLERSEPV
jgi:DNA-binding GntR family transcriptional regulator